MTPKSRLFNEIKIYLQHGTRNPEKNPTRFDDKARVLLTLCDTHKLFLDSILEFRHLHAKGWKDILGRRLLKEVERDRKRGDDLRQRRKNKPLLDALQKERKEMMRERLAYQYPGVDLSLHWANQK